jgi:hypothetical protein
MAINSKSKWFLFNMPGIKKRWKWSLEILSRICNLLLKLDLKEAIRSEKHDFNVFSIGSMDNKISGNVIFRHCWTLYPAMSVLFRDIYISIETLLIIVNDWKREIQ